MPRPLSIVVALVIAVCAPMAAGQIVPVSREINVSRTPPDAQGRYPARWVSTGQFWTEEELSLHTANPTSSTVGPVYGQHKHEWSRDYGLDWGTHPIGDFPNWKWPVIYREWGEVSVTTDVRPDGITVSATHHPEWTDFADAAIGDTAASATIVFDLAKPQWYLAHIPDDDFGMADQTVSIVKTGGDSWHYQVRWGWLPGRDCSADELLYLSPGRYTLSIDTNNFYWMMGQGGGDVGFELTALPEPAGMMILSAVVLVLVRRRW